MRTWEENYISSCTKKLPNVRKIFPGARRNESDPNGVFQSDCNLSVSRYPTGGFLPFMVGILYSYFNNLSRYDTLHRTKDFRQHLASCFAGPKGSVSFHWGLRFYSCCVTLSETQLSDLVYERDAGNLLAVWEGHFRRAYVFGPFGYVKDWVGVAKTWRDSLHQVVFVLLCMHLIA